MGEEDGNTSIATEISQTEELQAGYSGGHRCSSAPTADGRFIMCPKGIRLDQC